MLEMWPNGSWKEQLPEWRFRTNTADGRFSPKHGGTPIRMVLKVPGETGEGEIQLVVNTSPWGSEKKPKVQVSINGQPPVQHFHV